LGTQGQIQVGKLLATVSSEVTGLRLAYANDMHIDAHKVRNKVIMITMDMQLTLNSFATANRASELHVCVKETTTRLIFCGLWNQTSRRMPAQKMTKR
jgi:hypothetical protein